MSQVSNVNAAQVAAQAGKAGAVGVNLQPEASEAAATPGCGTKCATPHAGKVINSQG